MIKHSFQIGTILFFDFIYIRPFISWLMLIYYLFLVVF